MSTGPYTIRQNTEPVIAIGWSATWSAHDLNGVEVAIFRDQGDADAFRMEWGRSHSVAAAVFNALDSAVRASKETPSRALSIVITKLEEAELWLGKVT